MIPEFANTLNKLIELHKKKNDDYSGDKGAFFNFAFCDQVSALFKNSRDKVYAVFIAVKLARLAVTLSADKVNNESIEDSFDDLIVYATIWKCDYLDRMKPLEKYMNSQGPSNEESSKLAQENMIQGRLGGAKDERKAWMELVNRLENLHSNYQFKTFGAKRAKRYNAKPGGLGKK